MELANREYKKCIPTAVSVGGFCLVVAGVQKGVDTPVGLALVCTGRAMDLADGFIANRYGLSTRTGAYVDAVLDKFGGALVLENTRRSNNISKAETAGIFGQNLINGIATYVANYEDDRSLRPNRDGKNAMFLQSSALILDNAAAIAKRQDSETVQRLGRRLRQLGGAATALGVGHYGRRASTQYVRRALAA